MLNNFVFSVKNGHYIKTHDTNYKYILSLVVVLDFFLQPKVFLLFYLWPVSFIDLRLYALN